MAIEMKGRLDSAGLTEIFRILMDQDNQACSLLVSDGVSEKIFYFSIGGLRLVSVGGRKTAPIGEVMVQQGSLTAEQRDEVLERLAKSERRFGEEAKELGFVGAADVERAVRSQVEFELCDLFLWEDAEYEFREGQPPPQFYDARYRACSISTDIPVFIRGVEARRDRFDQIRKKIPSDREILEPTEKGREVQSHSGRNVESIVLGAVDGRRRILEIVQKTGFAALLVHETLYDLLEKGLVRRTAGSEGGAELGREELLAEIANLERARADAMGDLILRTRLAKAYEKVGEAAKAARIWKEIAKLQRRKNDMPAALAAFREAARCLPQDFSSREQVLEILRSMRDIPKYVEEGRALAEAYLKNNLLNRARHLLATLTGFAPHDARLRKLYALTLLALGEKDLALWQLKELATILEQDPSRVSELKEVYRRILALDKGDRKTRRKLLVVTGRHRAVWISRVVIAASLLVLVGAGGLFAYELSARNHSPKGMDLEKLLLDHEFEEARGLIVAAREDYPFSSIARQAAERLALVDRYEKAYFRDGLRADLLRAQRAFDLGNTKEANRIFLRIGQLDPETDPAVANAVAEARRYLNMEDEARRRVEQGQLAAQDGDLEKAIRIYQSVLAAYPDTQAVRDISWPVRVDTVPTGARVFVNGIDMGPAPRTVFYSLRTKTNLQVEMPGFTPARIEMGERLPAELKVPLQRETRWVFAGEGPFEGSPVLSGETLYVTGRDRYLYAIDASEGRLKFRVCLGIFGDSGAAPAVRDGVVVVGTSRGELVGVDSALGNVLWRRSVGAPVAADLAADPAVSAVYVTLSDGTVTAVRPATGAELWTRAVRAAPASAPAVAEATVFVGSYDRRSLIALDTSEGGEVWEVSADGPIAGPPAARDSILCFGSDDQHLYAVDLRTRTELGPYRASGMLKARPAIANGKVWFGSMDGNVYCYPLTAGAAPDWTRNLGYPILSEIAVERDRVYVGTTSGELHCLDRRTGVADWIFRAKGKIVSRPLVVNGTVYLTSMDGRIYAIRQ